ncbi:hypothetical protein L1D32_06685 [Shewanella insulae]|uniref:Uncharacterized protein n=1 Tax=Shewanella insulae TaxID=2681496 RepID=A0A6L7I201_9GAMM|nr:hypothetical protein [Shewanella insulae]MCG9737833.1 hypothetical protein [Shewanella insulae]MCG9756799.1 hypothetical protein [Shewanella insulae]MXR70595.1 hypothetical protein [Shewanella insulae]
MLAASLTELFIWFVWEICLSFVLYTTGAAVIALLTFGRVQKPLYWPALFHQEKRLAKNDFYAVYMAGFFFYLLLFTLLIYLG